MECKSLLLRFFEIYMTLSLNNLIFDKNRTSKLVHSDSWFFNSPFSLRPATSSKENFHKDLNEKFF